jgi:hypothetical protein
MTILACLILQCPLWACSVPVFRYALERWPADSYRFVVFNEGPLSSSDSDLTKQLSHIETMGYGRPPLLGQTVDVTQDIPEALSPLWDEDKHPPLPAIMLLPPGLDPNVQALWEAPLNQASVQMLLNSPVRQEVVQRLTDGQTAVWLFLRSEDPDLNAQLEADLQKQLKVMEDTLKLPHELSEDDAVYDTPMSEVDLRIEFSVVPLDLHDPNETILTTIIRQAMPDDLAQYLPAAIPIFGRGRALTVLDKTSIVPDVVEEICHFLVGPCSCQVKQLNPGMDLLMPVDWDGLVTGLIGMEDIVPTLIVPVAATTSPSNEPNMSLSEPNAEPILPVAVPVVTSTNLGRNLKILAFLGLVILIAATLALKKGASK